VSTNSLDFGDTTVDLPLTVSNGAQGVILWNIDSASFPVWLEALNRTGVLGPNESDSFNIRVHRESVTSGDYNTTITVSADNGQTQDIQVHMTKP